MENQKIFEKGHLVILKTGFLTKNFLQIIFMKNLKKILKLLKI